MKFSPFLAPLLAAAAVAACGRDANDGDVSSPEAATMTRPIIVPVPAPRELSLSVDELVPATPFEGQPTFVRFTMCNTTATARTGWVAPRVRPIDAPPYEPYAMDGDWRVVNLGAFQCDTGMLRVAAPAHAGVGHGIEVYFYDTRPIIAEFRGRGPAVATSPLSTFDVAGRYSFQIPSLTAKRIRNLSYAGASDHVVVSCAAGSSEASALSCYSTNGVPMTDAPGVKAIGDVTGYKEVGVGAGPFLAVPGRSPDARFAYSMIHTGDTALPVLHQTLDILSTISAKALSATYPGYTALWEAGDQLTKLINSNISACGGLVADDTLVFSSTELRTFTAGGAYTATKSYGGDYLAPGSPYLNPGCGGTPWYDVTFRIQRQPFASDLLDIFPAIARLAKGRGIKLQLLRDAQPEAALWSVTGGVATGYFTATGDGDVTFTLTRDLAPGELVEVVATASDGRRKAEAWLAAAVKEPLTVVRVAPR